MLTNGLSATWAMAAALRGRGVAPPSQAMLFGLGAGAWYEVDAGAGADATATATASASAAPVLRACHPDLIRVGLHGLNVYAVRFNYLSADVLEPLRERTRLGAQTMITVNRWALPAGALPTLPPPGCDQACTLLVQADEAAADGTGYAVQGCGDIAPWHLPEDALLRAWFVRQAGARRATFYWHPVVTLTWQPAPAIRRALQGHVAHMTQTWPGRAASGLRALQQLPALGDGDLHDLLVRTARCAAADGGLGLGRELLAAFMNEAAEIVHEPALHGAADRCASIAALWHDLLHEALHGQLQAASARTALAELLRQERLALEGVARAAAASGSGCARCCTTDRTTDRTAGSTTGPTAPGSRHA